MTMLFNNVVWFPVVPVAGKRGWFEIAGRAVLTCECDVMEYINSMGEDKVEGAKLVGFHDNEDIMARDPRFNGFFDTEEPGFGVVEYIVARAERQHRGIMLVNAPEQVLFEYARDKWDEPFNADDFPTWKAGAREAGAAQDPLSAHERRSSPLPLATPEALRQKAHQVVDEFVANQSKPATTAKPRGKVRAAKPAK